ncbi:hypothetical protein MKX01_019072 [Papaver californicum]|nr:hypothetical protein MKX01_019072 [Papaver californicum]
MSSSISLSEISSHEAEHHRESSSSRHNSKWVIYVKEKLHKRDKSNEVHHWEKKCIYQIPACVKDLNKKAYKPQAVSFGPYHGGEDQLNQMEEHKHRALLHFLERSNKPIELYLDALHRVGKHLIDSYDSLHLKWIRHRNDNAAANDDHTDQYGNYSDQFLQLMMLDSCFMLEILRTATRTTGDYVYIMPYIRRDMLMLQNQLPMLLLDTLLAVENGGTGGTIIGVKPKYSLIIEEYLNRIIIEFYTQATPIHSFGKCLHIVDLYRKNLLQDPPRKMCLCMAAVDSRSESVYIILSAAEIYEAGIRFKTSKTVSLRDISFCGGVLRLPMIVVDDTTESTFLNLMAYVRFHVGAGNEVTANVFLMDKIIDSAKDVSLLISSGIIQNAIGSDKAVAKLFNELAKDVTLDPDSSLEKVHMKVNDYCKKKWNAWRANLVRTYFRSPWAILSLLAALFLMALTMFRQYIPYLITISPTVILPKQHFLLDPVIARLCYCVVCDLPSF